MEKNKEKENRNVDEGRKKEKEMAVPKESWEYLCTRKGGKSVKSALNIYWSTIFLERSWNIADMSICTAGPLVRFRNKWKLQAVLL